MSTLKTEARENRKARFWSCDPDLFAPQVAQELWLAEVVEYEIVEVQSKDGTTKKKRKRTLQLTALDRIIIVTLEMDRAKGSEVAFTSTRRLARLNDVTREAVREGLKRLEKFGLKRQRVDGKPAWNLALFWGHIGLLPRKPLKEEKRAYLQSKKELEAARQANKRLEQEKRQAEHNTALAKDKVRQQEQKLEELERKLKEAEMRSVSPRYGYRKPAIADADLAEMEGVA